jgi:hypothetical protein
MTDGIGVGLQSDGAGNWNLATLSGTTVTVGASSGLTDGKTARIEIEKDITGAYWYYIYDAAGTKPTTATGKLFTTLSEGYTGWYANGNSKTYAIDNISIRGTRMNLLWDGRMLVLMQNNEYYVWFAQITGIYITEYIYRRDSYYPRHEILVLRQIVTISNPSTEEQCLRPQLNIISRWDTGGCRDYVENRLLALDNKPMQCLRHITMGRKRLLESTDLDKMRNRGLCDTVNGVLSVTTVMQTWVRSIVPCRSDR